MKVLIITILVFLVSCYTVIDKRKNFSNSDFYPIKDTTVFLPKVSFKSNEFVVKELINVWVNSLEKKHPIIWRPIDYKDFPTLRFRDKIIFHHNGEFEKLILAPNDAHFLEKFRWRLLKNNIYTIVIFNSEGKRIYSMTIDKLDSKTLIFKDKKAN